MSKLWSYVGLYEDFYADLLLPSVYYATVSRNCLIIQFCEQPVCGILRVLTILKRQNTGNSEAALNTRLRFLFSTIKSLHQDKKQFSASKKKLKSSGNPSIAYL